MSSLYRECFVTVVLLLSGTSSSCSIEMYRERRLDDMGGR